MEQYFQQYNDDLKNITAIEVMNKLSRKHLL